MKPQEYFELVAGRVHKARINKQLSVTQLAHRLGVTPNHIEQLENANGAYQNGYFLERIAEALEVPLDDIQPIIKVLDKPKEKIIILDKPKEKIEVIMANEKSWVLLGGVNENLWWGRMTKQTQGLPCSVEFNYDWTLYREETKGDCRGWLHTHPSFSANPSERDHRTMKAWVTCFGKPLVACIHGVDGLRAWWYLNDEDMPVEKPVKKLGHFIFGLMP
jgi:transcriptional regulator with XRE-family HTH domain